MDRLTTEETARPLESRVSNVMGETTNAIHAAAWNRKVTSKKEHFVT